MTLDLSATIVAKSDQLNADDLVSGPITVTITGASRGKTEEQPVDLALSGGHRPWRPCKTCRRVLIFAWGADAGAWVGRSLTLYRDARVTWGGVAVGGIRISAMSHLKESFTISLAVSKGKKEANKVAVLSSQSVPLDTSADAPASKAGRDKAIAAGAAAGLSRDDLCAIVQADTDGWTIGDLRTLSAHLAGLRADVSHG